MGAFVLQRLFQDPIKGTLGKIDFPVGPRAIRRIYTLELPWKGNRANVSCIPRGLYRCQWDDGGTGRFNDNWQILGIPDRQAIEIHRGNFLRHTKGCILPGLSYSKDHLSPNSGNEEFAVWQSKDAMKVLRGRLGGKDFDLIVRDVL